MKTTPSSSLVTEVSNDLYLPNDTGNALVPGVIYLANEARFTSAFYSEPLTAYLQGWRDPEDLEGLLEKLAPVVEVGRRFEFKKADNTEAFLSEDDDVRTTGSNFKMTEYKGYTVNEKTLNKGLGMRIDHDETYSDDYKQIAVRRLRQRLARNEIRRILALINAASVNTGVTWSSGTPNPDKDVRDALRAIADASGIRGTHVVFSEDARDKRLDAYEIANTPYAGRAAALTEEQMASKYGVDMVLTMKARYQSTLTAKALLQTANTVLLYNALAGASKDDPSNVKRFVTPTDAGRWKVYITEHEKYTDVFVEHYSNVVITSTIGIRKITAA